MCGKSDSNPWNKCGKCMPNRVTATGDSEERLGHVQCFQLLRDDRRTAQTWGLSAAGSRTEAGCHNPGYSPGVLAAILRLSQDINCSEGAPLAPEGQLHKEKRRNGSKGAWGLNIGGWCGFSSAGFLKAYAGHPDVSMKQRWGPQRTSPLYLW